MRVMMLGTGPFAVPTFRFLTRSEHEVAALVTRPAAAVRSRKPWLAQPLREMAEAERLAILEPEDINAESAQRALRRYQVALFVVCDYGQILSPETLTIPPLGGINLHGSLLPKYRGAAPVQWAILQGETESGVTVIHMTPRLDAGPCLARRRTAIDPQETAAQLEPRLAELGVEAVRESLQRLATWDGASPLGDPQDASRATRAPRLRKSDGLVDWSRRADQLYNQVRGLTPWPGTYTYWQRAGGEPLRLILNEVAADLRASPQHSPGTVVQAGPDRIVVAAGRGCLEILRLQPSGKRVLSAADFLRGYPLQAGARFAAQA